MGRYIAKEVLSRLKEQKLLEEYGLEELTGPFESVVEMACLMHDIGNPPFGHFGEAAINDWFRQRSAPGDALGQPLTDDRCEVQALRLHEGETALNALRRKCAGSLQLWGQRAGDSSGPHADADESDLGAGGLHPEIYPTGVVVRGDASQSQLFNEEARLLFSRRRVCRAPA